MYSLSTVGRALVDAVLEEFSGLSGAHGDADLARAIVNILD